MPTESSRQKDKTLYDGANLVVQSSLTPVFVRTAVNLLEHCRLVSLSDFHKAKKALAKMSQPFTIVGSDFIKAKGLPVQALVSYRDDAIVVAFRGSGVFKDNGRMDVKRTIVNAIADATVLPVPHRESGGELHSGFALAYRQIEDEVQSRFKKAREKSPRATIYITGFSLGSALATLTAWDLREHNPQVYLFATPAVGDSEFTSSYDRALPHTYRFAHEADIVAEIPHGLFCEYKASGNKLFVFDDSSKQTKQDQMDLLIKANRILLLTMLPGNPGFGLALLVALAKAGKSFVTVHTPEKYIEWLKSTHAHFDTHTLSKKSPETSATTQAKLCARHCVSLVDILATTR